MAKQIQKWTRPDYYFGAEWHDYYTFLGQHRDSDILEQSNFATALENLGGESDTVLVVRENHFLVGWVEWIAIHESDTDAQDKANVMYERMDGYPVLDEEDFSRRKWENAVDTWTIMSVKERIDAIHDYGRDCSIFAARREEIPDDDGIDEYLRS
jgi:hypothetical protein